MTVVEEIGHGWKRWCGFVGDRFSGPVNAVDCARICQRFRYFSPQHREEADWIQAVLAALSKGKHLVEAALQWEEPAVGQKCQEAPSRTDRARGQQWRLVMAYGGLETMVKALLAVQRGGRADSRALADFVEKCRPDSFEALPPPTVSESALDKIFQLPQPTDDHPLLAFLDLNPSNASTIHDWMVKGQPVNSWPGAIKLAKALRDATAHGALSASKVLEWRLLPTCEQLALRMGRLAAAALRQLARVPPPPEEIEEKPCPDTRPDTPLRKPKRRPRKPALKKGQAKRPDPVAEQPAAKMEEGVGKEVEAVKAVQPDPLDEPL